MFRLCFTGNFQICVFLETFWFKRTSIFWCVCYAFCFILKTHPSHTWLFLLLLYSLSYSFVASFALPNDPSNVLGVASPAVLVLYRVVSPLRPWPYSKHSKHPTLSLHPGGFASAVVPASSPSLGFLLVTTLHAARLFSQYVSRFY